MPSSANWGDNVSLASCQDEQSLNRSRVGQVQCSHHQTLDGHGGPSFLLASQHRAPVLYIAGQCPPTLVVSCKFLSSSNSKKGGENGLLGMLRGVMILCHFEGCSPTFYCQRSKCNEAKLKIRPETCTDSFYSSGVLLQTTPVLVSSRITLALGSVSCGFGRHVTRRLGCYNY